MAPRTPKTPAKRKHDPIGRGIIPVRLRYDDQTAPASSAVPRQVYLIIPSQHDIVDIEHLISQKNLPPFNGNEDLIFMALDIVEEANGAPTSSNRYKIWGTTPNGASVLCTISDFEPYFYIAAPQRHDPNTSDPSGKLEKDKEITNWGKKPQLLNTLCALLNRSAPLDSQIQRIEPVVRRPILYYRPDSPQGDTYLKIILAPTGNVRRAGTQILRAITNRPGLRTQGFVWRDQTMYEHEVNPLQRFLADVPCSGGAWMMIPPSAAGAPIAGDGGGGGGGGLEIDDQGEGKGKHIVNVTTPLKACEAIHTRTMNVTTPSATTVHSGYTLLSFASPSSSSSHSQQRMSIADIEVTAPWKSVICLTPDATQLADATWSPFNNGNSNNNSGNSRSENLKKDTFQKAANNKNMNSDSTRSASTIIPSTAACHAAEAARRGDIAPVRLMVLDVCSATKDGIEKAPVATQGDPIVAISCTLVLQKHGSINTHDETVETAAAGMDSAAAKMEEKKKTRTIKTDKAAVVAGGKVEEKESREKEERKNEEEDVINLTGIDTDDRTGADIGIGGEGGPEEEEDGGGAGGAQVVAPSAGAVLGGPRSAQHAAAAVKIEHGEPRPVVFLLSPSLHSSFSSSDVDKRQRLEKFERSVRELYSGAEVMLCSSEAELLLTWQKYVMGIDPDVIALFQVGNTLETISQRFQQLRLGGSSGGGGSGVGLQLSRLLPQHAKSGINIRRITMYSAAWVRSQSRMSSTSNQETFKADIDGRLVIDVLRQVLTSNNLASFSLVDCVQSILGETMEVLGAHKLACLAGIVSPGGGGGGDGSADEANAVRLARYSLRRTAAVHALLGRLATLPEAIEMARATGLTIGQVMYNAQMVRTWSLLLRVGQRQNIIISSRPESSTPLSEHTFILHPVEARTTGLHKQPVAILDFASLYPSIYRAYNLCYTTLVHEDDAKTLPPEYLTKTPTGACFINPEICPGILPSILAALISARAATRAELATTKFPAQRAVLDSRQKALKVTANALYGFTGAQASPLQCVPLADSCLAYGAQSCRKAKEVLESAAAMGQLGAPGKGAKVIYGHTDSLFVLIPSAADVATAIQVGHLASEIVSAAFPNPMELKFERVCSPLMLLHVNRYAGRAFERESDISRGGDLIVKGLKSMWRQTAPFLRTILHGSLVRILMQNDVFGAISFAQGEIKRLLSGKAEIWELVMTGGLWRVTGDQIDQAAAGTLDTTNGGGGSTSTRGFFDLGIPTTSPATGSGGGGGGAAGGEVRGPHASLAVRLTQRDPGRSFVLGERLQYVLTSGHKLQDDAAEDPYVAIKSGLRPDYDLYWKNKIQKPLTELFATCLTPTQLQSLVSGPHTLVKVDKAPVAANGSAGPGPSSSFPPSKGKRGGIGGGGGSGSTPGSSGQRQMGMMQFFKTTAKCLGCRRALITFKGAAEDAPGLCDSCANEPGRWEEAYLGAIEEESEAEARNCAAHAACRQCHSGLVSQAVLCDNSECPVTFTRLGTAAALQSAQKSLRRLDIF